MYGMISRGGGFGRGMWMPMRLQRALRYGTARVASRAESSAKVVGGVILVMSFAYIIGPLFFGRLATQVRDGGIEVAGSKLSGFQVRNLKGLAADWEFGSLSDERGLNF
jgi:hypothetical protein